MTRWERQLFESGQITADELHKRIKKRKGEILTRRQVINILLISWVAWSIIAVALSGRTITEAASLTILITSAMLWRWNNKGGKK